MITARGARLVSAIACTAVMTVGLAACSSDDSSPEALTSPTATGPVPELAPGLLGTCTQVLNDRDQTVFLDAGRSSFDLYQAVLDGGVPSATDLSRWQRTLEAGIAQITAELEVLRAASTDPAWSDVLIPMEELLGQYTARLALVSGPWPAGEDATLYGPTDLTTDVDAAAASLGMTGRDCESLATEPGPTPAFAEFVTSAAIVCSAVLDRRRDAGYPAAQQSMMDVVVQVVREETVEVAPELIDAVRAVATEWSQTADDLATIPGTVPDAEAWEKVRAAVQDRADLYAERVDALESGDRAAISEAFPPDTSASGSSDLPWEQLGLDQRDCRSIDA